MSMYYHPDLINLYVKLLEELDFRIIKYNDGIKLHVDTETKLGNAIKNNPAIYSKRPLTMLDFVL